MWANLRSIYSSVTVAEIAYHGVLEERLPGVGGVTGERAEDRRELEHRDD